MGRAWFSQFEDEEPEQTEAPYQESIPSELEPVDYKILTLLFEGRKPIAICQELDLDRPEFDARTKRAAFEDIQRRVEKAMLAKITGSGEFEPLTSARAEAPQAMKRIITQGRLERDPKVRLAANQSILKFAGVEPARKVEVVTPDKLLDQMTPEELALFAAHRKWPSRFKEALRAYLPKQDPIAIEVETRPAAVTPPAEPPDSQLPPVE